MKIKWYSAFTERLPKGCAIQCLFLLFVSFMGYSQISPTSQVERQLGADIKSSLIENSTITAPFRSIGPSIMGGRVADIEVNPDDPKEFYVAYATGGVWYTKNNGQSFIPIFDSVDVFSIGDIAVSWNSEKAPRAIWVGTGDESGTLAYAGSGVYMSSTNGRTWNFMGLSEAHHIGKIILNPNKPSEIWVASMGHHFTKNKERGVYKSTDNGKSWDQVLYINDSTGCIDLEINPVNSNEIYACMWRRVRSVSKNYKESEFNGGIYKSINGGNDWKFLTDSLSGFPPARGVSRVGIAIYPKNPQIVYAVVENILLDSNSFIPPWWVELNLFKKTTIDEFLNLSDNELNRFLKKHKGLEKYDARVIKDMVTSKKVKPTILYDYFYSAEEPPKQRIGTEIYRSDNGGLSWNRTMKSKVHFDYGMGYYFGKVYVSPNNENKIFIPSVELMVSEDGGKTVHSIAKRNTHEDFHAVWINPKDDNHLIVGNDGGVNITYDFGDNWFKVIGPSVGQFYDIDLDNSNPYNIYGGLQDNGFWYGPSNSKEDGSWITKGIYPFRKIGGSDGMQIQVDKRYNVVYCGIQNGMVYRKPISSIVSDINIGEPNEVYDLYELNESEKFNKSENGDTIKSIMIKATHDLGEDRLRFNWKTPFLISAHDQNILYYGTNRFHRSLNKGESLTALSKDITGRFKSGYRKSFATITTITESPLRFGLLYVGTDNGYLQLSKDGGFNWVIVGQPFSEHKNIIRKGILTETQLKTQGLWVSSVQASRHNEGCVYVALNGRYYDNFLPYLYISNDYGKTWQQIGKDLPNEPINVIMEDPKQDSLIYVGTDGGLYVSHNAGNSFMIWNKGLPQSVPINDIVIQERENEIVLGTFGRGLYVAKLDEVHRLVVNKLYLRRKPPSN